MQSITITYTIFHSKNIVVVHIISDRSQYPAVRRSKMIYSPSPDQVIHLNEISYKQVAWQKTAQSDGPLKGMQVYRDFLNQAPDYM